MIGILKFCLRVLPFMLIATPFAHAQGLIRDSEIERTLRLITAPIAKAAGVGRVNILSLTATA